METKPSYYAIIPASVRYDKTIPPNAKLMYGEITALANIKGYCYAGNDYFAELYDVSPETVSRWVSKLSKAKHIFVEIDQNNKNPRKIYLSEPLDKKINSSCQKSQEALDENIKTINSIDNTTVKSTQKEKLHLGTAVRMTEDELSKLYHDHGTEKTDWMIVKLENYKLANGKTYKSDYRAILNWVVDEANKVFKTKPSSEGRLMIGYHHTTDYKTNEPVRLPVYEGDTLPRFGFERLVP